MDPHPPAGPPPLALASGDVVRLRRAHPCGGREWRVVRVGADIGITCLTCERRLMVDRRELERRIAFVERPAAFPGEETA